MFFFYILLSFKAPKRLLIFNKMYVRVFIHEQSKQLMDFLILN